MSANPPETSPDDDPEAETPSAAPESEEIESEEEEIDSEDGEIPPDAEELADEAESAEPEELLPMVAIVGRPNVGKSTLYNRLTGRRDALVHEKAGMTRDRRIGRVEWDGRAFLCVDTGGFDVGLDDPLINNVVGQARLAMQEADAIILLTALGESANPAEREMLDLLRKSGKPVVVAVNKCDNPTQEMGIGDFYRLGFKDVFPLSAAHGRGTAELMDAVFEKLDERGVVGAPAFDGGIRLAVVGRQNVGKSTLINRLIGEERMIASDEPGTTRDAIDTPIRTEEGDIFTLIDTAGIRRRGKVEKGFEKLSVLSSMVAMRRADVTAIVIDGSSGLTAQDAHIAGYCVDEGRACILVVNKWDIVEKDHRTADLFTKMLHQEWGFLKHAPVVYVSALTGQRASKILEVAKRVHANASRRISTPKLNERLKEWTTRRSPPMQSAKRPKFKYMAQYGVRPPSFNIFVNDPTIIHFSYQRYLVNCLREAYDFEGTPIRIVFKGGKDRHDTEGER